MVNPSDLKFREVAPPPICMIRLTSLVAVSDTGWKAIKYIQANRKEYRKFRLSFRGYPGERGYGDWNTPIPAFPPPPFK